MVNSYPARTKSKTWHYLSDAVHVTTLRDGLFQHFYQHLGCYNRQAHTTQLTGQCIIVYKVIYLLTKHELCRLFCLKMYINCCYGNWSITRVTGVRGVES